ncbi:MAG: class I SAM-dependent methyltransferase [Rhizobiaceae bacterium]|nr:class I SAM-dependent methyltransferase [Rhizobiaceae bacterium]
MTVFGRYSRYYDLLYADKDYEGEAAFVRAQLLAFAPDATEILELGCGTGKHAELMARESYVVHGVDLSEDMLALAEKRRGALGAHLAARLSYAHGDARTYASGRTYDAVISLFHVVSYQPNNDDLIAMFENAASQLNPGGVFLFDYWYGPAVMTQQPETRVKRLSDDAIEVMRVAEPVIDTGAATVDVNYDIYVRDRSSGAVEQIRESHKMHYLFATEIDLLARLTGFSVKASFEFQTGAKPSPDTWSVCSVLVKT